MGKSILLVDYDPHNIGRVRRLLRARGYEVHIAKDGLAGIDAFRRLDPVLTIVQDLLPKRSGEEVCRALKDLAFGGAAKIVLVVPSCKRGTRGAEVPWCDAILESPFEEASLLALARRFAGEGLHETPPARGPAVRGLGGSDVAPRPDLMGGPQPGDRE